MSEPVADLVRRARSRRVSIGEQHRAFSDLVERFEPMAYATALTSCDDREHARDACQEAFLLAWRILPRLREPGREGQAERESVPRVRDPDPDNRRDR